MSTATMAMAITIMAVAATMYMPTGSFDVFDVGWEVDAADTTKDVPAWLP
jgi:hypothetical protein